MAFPCPIIVTLSGVRGCLLTPHKKLTLRNGSRSDGLAALRLELNGTEGRISRHHPCQVSADHHRQGLYTISIWKSSCLPLSLAPWAARSVMSQTMMGWEKTEVLAVSSWKCYKQSRRLLGHKACLWLLKTRRLSRRPRRRNLAKAIDRTSDFRGRVGMLGMELQPQSWEIGHLVPKP